MTVTVASIVIAGFGNNMFTAKYITAEGEEIAIATVIPWDVFEQARKYKLILDFESNPAFHHAKELLSVNDQSRKEFNALCKEGLLFWNGERQTGI